MSSSIKKDHFPAKNKVLLRPVLQSLKGKSVLDNLKKILVTNLIKAKPWLDKFMNESKGTF